METVREAGKRRTAGCVRIVRFTRKDQAQGALRLLHREEKTTVLQSSIVSCKSPLQFANYVQLIRR